MKCPPTDHSSYAVSFLFLCVIGGLGFAQTVTPAPHPGPVVQQVLSITVTDENGVAVPSARVFLQPSPAGALVWCVTDFAGHCYFRGLTLGNYQMRVEKQGFYAVTGQPVEIGQVPSVDVRLFHVQEVHEVVNVVESPPGIDPAQTASTEQLTNLDVLNIPYPSTHDYRNVLNFIPGVVQDTGGQPHIAGAQTYQTLTLLDGFNVTQPANGLLLLRVSTDAIRSINTEDSRISAEYGKGSGGVLSINTGIGDDHYRFTATNFLPSAQFKKGLSFDNVVPRITFSGPIRKRKIWFFEGADGEYDNIIIPELPSGSDHDQFWRVGNVAKLQVNLAPGNILTASYLINYQRDEHFGLSLFSPPSTTPRDTESGHFAMVKDQVYFSGGQLLEFGFNFDQYVSDLEPQGSQPSVSSNQAATGSYYLNLHTVARRWQTLANLSLAPHQWHGRHEFKLGIDLDRLAYNPRIQRNPIFFLRTGMQASAPDCFSPPFPCARYSTFSIGPHRELHNVEVGSYAQDRWSLTNRMLVEAGVRFDWDEIVRHLLPSPRLAGTYVLDNQGNTKLSAGIGIFYDATNMVLVSRPFAGQRIDYFFDNNGKCPSSPSPCSVPLKFMVNQHALHAPRFVNWSLAFERKLPAAVYLKAEYIQRRGTQGFVFNTLTGSPPLSGDYFLQNTRRDHYYSFQVSARKAFRKTYLVTGSYMYSRIRSNQALDFNVDNPVYSPQLPGPYQWDAPNRFLSTGIVPAKLPLLRQIDIEYSAEARNGFPFYVVNNQQQLVEPPGSRRFPPYFSLNLFVEKRFKFRGRYWAIRGGYADITGRANPSAVNNNIDSRPGFLTFGGFTRRAFTARIRLLERK
ncbi:MAG TPA: TonB-dependent receptor [Terriglobales bacterium]|nr:TonB-dependent receptor [Terriglobales bacterium]